MAATDLFGAIPLFSGLSKRDLSRLAKAATETSYAPETTLASEGEPGRFFFVIVDGQARVEVNGKKVATLGPGDYFGEMALIDRGPRSATVTTETPMTCLVLTQIEFRPFATEQPAVAWALLEAMVKRVHEARHSE